MNQHRSIPAAIPAGITCHILNILASVFVTTIPLNLNTLLMSCSRSLIPFFYLQREEEANSRKQREAVEAASSAILAMSSYLPSLSSLETYAKVTYSYFFILILTFVTHRALC
jgi:hypothetical protein